MRGIRVVAYRGKWCAITYIDGRRQRVSLKLPATAENRDLAEREARNLGRQIAAPTDDTVGAIMDAYLADSRAVDVTRLKNAWKALKPTFAKLTPPDVTREVCRQYVARRKREGRQDGTIVKELNTLRAGLRWHQKDTPAVVEAPSQPPPRDRWLDREEFGRLLNAAAGTPHLRVFLHLAIGTAGRKEAILEILWNHDPKRPRQGFVDFQKRIVNLGIKPNGKRRAIVPMTDTLCAVLSQAREDAQSDHVVEFEGKPVKSVRTAFSAAVRRTNLGDLHIHDLRHTAAVWMAQKGGPNVMEKIREYLGHTSLATTYRIYARFTPGYLKDVASALEIDSARVVHMNQQTGTDGDSRRSSARNRNDTS